MLGSNFFPEVFVDRLTRKELKKDKFALEVGHTVEFLEEHKKQLSATAPLAVAVVSWLVGWFYYSRRPARGAPAGAAAALTAMDAPIGAQPGARHRDLLFTGGKGQGRQPSALTDLATKHSRIRRGCHRPYYLGAWPRTREGWTKPPSG